MLEASYLLVFYSAVSLSVLATQGEPKASRGTVGAS